MCKEECIDGSLSPVPKWTKGQRCVRNRRAHALGQSIRYLRSAQRPLELVRRDDDVHAHYDT